MFIARKAASCDVQIIVEIAQQCQFDHGNTDGGFLVSDFSKSDYDKFLLPNRDIIFLVAENLEGQVVGFLFGCSNKYIEDLPARASERKIAALIGPSSNFYVIKQIAIHPDLRRSGVASALYRKFFVTLADAAPATTHVFATIVTTPLNRVSVDFHRRFGFRPVLSRSAESEKFDCIFDFVTYYVSTHRLTHGHDTREASLQNAMTIDATFESYKTALELYKHEDNLNWTKKKALITLALSALAALWVVSNNQPTKITFFALGLILVGGLVGIVSYVLQLKSGQRFFRKHKETGRILEAMLLIEGYLPAPFLLQVPRRATTDMIMNLLPVILIVVWLAVSIAIILQSVF